MAKRVIDDNTLTGIAEAIREKAKTTDGLTPLQMPGAILDIQGAEVEEITNEAGGKSVYINSEVPKLPEGFTRLQYIQSSGTQYVDTGFTPDSNTKVVMDAQSVGINTADTVQAFFGARSGSSFRFYAGWHRTSNLYYIFYNNTSATAASTQLTDRLVVQMDKNVLTVGPTINVSVAYANFACSNNMYLFAMNMDGAVDLFSVIRVYACKIYDNGTLVRDYVPCLDASGVAGLYDFVNGVFYADAAGGAFVAGPVVLEYELPEGYEELEYIQSNGSQYVDTGFKPNNNTRVVMDAQLLSTSAAGFYFGARASGYVDSFGVLFSSSAGALRSAYGSQNLSFATTNYTQKVHIDKNKTSCQLGSETLTHTAATFQNTYNMYLFASNEFGSVGSKAKMSLWGCQIYDNGTLIRYYVPCKNNNGEVGLWDAVNNTFTGDAAGVGFLAGPSKGVSKVVLEDQVLIDLTGDTVTPESLLTGFTAHDAMGRLIQGAASAGKPVATGTYTPTSNQTRLTVGGLSFQPSIVFIVAAKTGNLPWVSNYYAHAVELKDAESGFQQRYYGLIDIYGYPNGSCVQASGITLNSDGFTSYTSSYYFASNTTYYWYAIG